MADEDIQIKLTEEIINVEVGQAGATGVAGPTGPTGPASVIPGPTGPTGPAGTTEHNLLSNLGYEDSGHIGFQKQLVYDNAIGTYVVPKEEE